MPELRPQLSAAMTSLQSPIVDKDGKPTLGFHRMLERMVAMIGNDEPFIALAQQELPSREVEELRAELDAVRAVAENAADNVSQAAGRIEDLLQQVTVLGGEAEVRRHRGGLSDLDTVSSDEIDIGAAGSIELAEPADETSMSNNTWVTIGSITLEGGPGIEALLIVTCLARYESGTVDVSGPPSVTFSARVSVSSLVVSGPYEIYVEAVGAGSALAATMVRPFKLDCSEASTAFDVQVNINMTGSNSGVTYQCNDISIVAHRRVR
jgi:hypothetical protein